MKRGFFSARELKTKTSAHTTVARCGLCSLHKTCLAPKMQVTGQGRRRILIVGEAPGRQEDEYIDKRTGQKGKQFIGESGDLLRSTLKEFGIHPDRDCWFDNALRCHPKDNKLPKNPQPIIEACRPNLLKTIQELSPNVIIPLGSIACKSLMPMLWKDDMGPVSIWGSWRIPSQAINTWVCPTFHPAYILRQPGPVVKLKFRQDLKQALVLKDKPWKEVPDWTSTVECIYHPSQAAKAIRHLLEECGSREVPFAIDYETTCLKPEYDGAEIVSCSMSNGATTISYPWAGEAIEATSEAWKNPIGKIASNMKFEDRWTRKMLGHGIRSWYWDTMLAAHILDNREGICSVKFQAFVLCGVKAYNEHIEPFLDSGKHKHLNRIKELDIKDLLLYGGMDSKVEYEVAKRQIKLMERMSRV